MKCLVQICFYNEELVVIVGATAGLYIFSLIPRLLEKRTTMPAFCYWVFVVYFSSYYPKKEEFSGHARKANEAAQYSFCGEVILYNCHGSD
jgi:hypothetical protein